MMKRITTYNNIIIILSFILAIMILNPDIYTIINGYTDTWLKTQSNTHLNGEGNILRKFYDTYLIIKYNILTELDLLHTKMKLTFRTAILFLSKTFSGVHYFIKDTLKILERKLINHKLFFLYLNYNRVSFVEIFAYEYRGILKIYGIADIKLVPRTWARHDPGIIVFYKKYFLTYTAIHSTMFLIFYGILRVFVSALFFVFYHSLAYLRLKFTINLAKKYKNDVFFNIDFPFKFTKPLVYHPGFSFWNIRRFAFQTAWARQVSFIPKLYLYPLIRLNTRPWFSIILKFFNFLRVFFLIVLVSSIGLFLISDIKPDILLLSFSKEFTNFVREIFYILKYFFLRDILKEVKLVNLDDFFTTFLIGFDGITLLFIFLTLLVFGMVHYNIGTEKYKVTHYKFIIFLTFVLEIQLLLTFLAQNLLYFYIFFESTLIPMFFIVGFFGTRARKVTAAFYLFLYTIFGSLFLLIGILILYTYTHTFLFSEIYQYNFPIETQLLLWTLFFIGFAVKLPSIPFHLWLPEAHVEAPAVGSIVLASVLLKLGGYGLLRVSLKMFPEACIFFQPLVFVIALVSIIYASLTAIRQTDVKRVIAYSSIAHMNYALIGLFCFNKLGLLGSFYLMFGHGLVSGGLFYLIGVLYDRYGTRSIFYYGGLMRRMPIFCTFFLYLSLANMGFPGLVNFIGEFLVMLGIIQENIFLFLLTSIGFVLAAVYSIWLFNRIAYGNLKYNYLKGYQEILSLETSNNSLMLIIFLTLFLGLHTEFISLLLEPSIDFYLVDYNFNQTTDNIPIYGINTIDIKILEKV